MNIKILRLFISFDEVDLDVAEDLRSYLDDREQRWLKVAAPCLSFRVSIKSFFLYIERGTGQCIYKDIDSDNT